MSTRFVRVVDFSPVVLRWVIMTNRDSVTFTLSVTVLHLGFEVLFKLP